MSVLGLIFGHRMSHGHDASCCGKETMIVLLQHIESGIINKKTGKMTLSGTFVKSVHEKVI